jgi:hypothetical protein
VSTILGCAPQADYFKGCFSGYASLLCRDTVLIESERTHHAESQGSVTNVLDALGMEFDSGDAIEPMAEPVDTGLEEFTFEDWLLDSLAVIKVPASFRERDVEAQLLYKDIFEYVGFIPDTSSTMAAEAVHNESVCLREFSTNFIQRSWRELQPPRI